MTFRSVAVGLATVAATAVLSAENRPIDAERSTLTVLVYKSGLFSAFADDHVIRAPIAGGSISTDPPLAVEVSVRSANLHVLDPTLAADKRAEVQSRMPESRVRYCCAEIIGNVLTRGTGGASA